MLDVDKARWVSLVPDNSTGNNTVSPAHVVTSWMNINMNDVQELLNKAAAASPLGDCRKEQVEESKCHLQEVTNLIQKLKKDLFSVGSMQ